MNTQNIAQNAPPVLVSGDEIARLRGCHRLTAIRSLGAAGIAPDAVAAFGQRRINLYRAAKVPDILAALAVSIELTVTT